ncbi:MAG: hypothetical protein QG577_208, partial [Thermodesulfobacteriota bacterium]|nr:hypothetical protein [Thermodesulfobacteriota bacterium]
MNSGEKRILVVTSFGHFMSHYNMLVFPAIVLPLTSVLNMDMAAVLGLSFWQYLLFGVMALPWGIVGDRIGGKSLIALMFLGSGLCGCAAAFYMNDPTALSIALAGVGLFSAIYHPIGMGLISKGMDRVSVAMGYNAVFGGLGLALAPLITGVASWIAGPRSALLVLGVLNILGIGLLFLMPLHESKVKASHGETDDNGMIRAFLVLLIAMMLGGVAYTGASVIIPSYLQLKTTGIVAWLSSTFDHTVSANLVASILTTLVFGVGMLGQYVGGHVGERFPRRYGYLFFHAMCVPAALMAVFTQNIPLVAAASMYFFFQLGMQALENTLVAVYTPKRLHHSAYGLKFIVTFGVGALAVKMIQFIETRWGIENVFLALCFVS